MYEKIVQFNEKTIKDQIDELLRGIVEESLNRLLEVEAEKAVRATHYERSESSIEEAHNEIYQVGVSAHLVENTTEVICYSKYRYPPLVS